MDNQRLILFVVFSFSLLLLWEAWQSKDLAPQTTAPAVQSVEQAASGVPEATPATGTPQATQQAPQGKGLTAGARAIIETDVFRVEIDANGGDLRKLELVGYHELDNDKQPLMLLKDSSADPYVAQSGLLWGLPTHKDAFQLTPGVYKLSDDTLTLPMSWNNQSAGLAVEKSYVFHRGSYQIDVIQKITNSGSTPVQLESYAQLVRHGKAPAGESKFTYTFTGPAVYTEAAKFQKIKFDDIAEGDAEFEKSAKDGWVGMLQHHFVAAWLPKADAARTYYAEKLGDDLYSAGYKQPHGTLAPGQTISLSTRLYAGPQIQEKLEAAAPGLDLTRDYGWLTPLSAPMFWALEKIHGMVGNWGWAIVIFTVLLKLVLYPLSASGYKGMAQMRALAPRLQKMKEMYGDDRQKLHQAMGDLYKKEKVNPLGGCMPILLQIPVFIALYYVLIAAVEMRGAPWMGWITDLSAPDPFYVLPVLMGITSIIQVKLNPTPPDPIQAKVMMAMPIVFSVMFIFFASGLVLYWLVNNILSIAQQWAMNKKYGEGSGGKPAHAKNKPDLICAIATPPGRGGIGVVRVSGADLAAIAAGLIGKLPQARYAIYTSFLDASKQPIDQGIALYFPAPHSFTGEHVLELQGHGGPAVMHALLARCLELGARLAQPGEFTYRAFLNGKLDLAQAESVVDLIDASSIEAARSALHSLTGEFSRRIQAMQMRLTELRMRVEASLDFPEEEDVVEAEQEKVRAGILATLEELAGVLAAARQGALLRDGVRVALIGQPNVGKSSLMNALAGEEVAIVTEFAGTTRDALRQEVVLEGVSFHLVDTAGLRETVDPVERMGIARTWGAVEQAGIALLLVDSQHGLGAQEQAIIARLPQGIARITIHNKIDLSGEVARFQAGPEIWLSAKTGEGIDLLRAELLRVAGWKPTGEGGFMARQRHLDVLARAQARLRVAQELSGQLELQAEELRLAQEALSEITGEFTPDDLLGEIFSRFCIGK